VFLVALSLTLALSLAAPASSLSSGAAVAVCFSPEENCAAFADRAIGNAEREILVGAYGLTTGSGIVEALIHAKQRGIDVRLIADKTTPCERNSAVEPLATAGVPIWIDDRARIAHAKTMVIDGTVTLTGSYNWTRGELGEPEPDLVPCRRSGLRGALAAAPCGFGPVRPQRGLVPGRDD
jgi:PLD-like domain